MDRKYGLQLRVKPSQQKKPKPSLPHPAAFGGDDDSENVERDIYRQAYKNKSLKDVEEQQKKALEEDPSAFDYDGVYDQMKQKAARPVSHDKQERKPKYIAALIEKNKQREREHEVVYERKLAKERDQDAHLFADKDKFVTGAYKRKLAEQAKWAQEERLRELKEAKDDSLASLRNCRSVLFLLLQVSGLMWQIRWLIRTSILFLLLQVSGLMWQIRWLSRLSILFLLLQVRGLM